MATVLVTSRSFSQGDRDLLAQLAEAGHSVVRGKADHGIEELTEILPAVDAWIAGTGAVTDEHLRLAPALRVIARYGVGFEAVDRVAAARRGIPVTNTPGANSSAVADHALGLMLAVLRHIPEGDRRVRAGDWTVVRGRELGSLRVGIAGFGRIGRGVAQRLSGFGSPVSAFDPWLDDAAIVAAGATPLDFASFATECDLISLHAPGGTTLVDEAWLETVTPGVVLVNTARPDLIDEAALADAIRDGRVSGFAADTLNGDTSGLASPLLADDLADRVVVTPHFGAQTVEAVDLMGQIAVDNVLAILAGHTAPNLVDPPATE